jgi:hypothetical protein
MRCKYRTSLAVPAIKHRSTSSEAVTLTTEPKIHNQEIQFQYLNLVISKYEAGGIPQRNLLLSYDRVSVPVRGETFPFSTASRRARGHNQPPIQRVSGALPRGKSGLEVRVMFDSL